MPGNVRGASYEPAPHKINPGEKISLAVNDSAARTARVLREFGYSEWVIQNVLRMNRMRADGVKWEIRPIEYPKCEAA